MVFCFFFLFFLFFRILQHPNILQCLGQCVEAIPILLVFEYCEMVSVQPPFAITNKKSGLNHEGGSESGLAVVQPSCSALVFFLLWCFINWDEIVPTGVYHSCEMFLYEQMWRD